MQPVPKPLAVPWPLIAHESCQSLRISVCRKYHHAEEEEKKEREKKPLNLPPKESPAVRVVIHLRDLGRVARVCLARSVRGAVILILGMVGREDGKCLCLVGACVVRALGGLDVGRDFGGGAAEVSGTCALGVGRAGIEGGQYHWQHHGR